MAEELYLLDTNILIRWLRREVAEHSMVSAAIEQLARQNAVPCYTSQNLGELWNVLTRPADRNGYGLSPSQADQCAQILESDVYMLPDTPEVHFIWRRLLVAHGVCGAQVHDARLVAAMHVHSVKRILTFNTKDFSRFDGIEAVHPADLS
ncbi:MAG TPA: PIN domain-containing protein [Terracidiphilus sp.]|nr:PIN domain-containing protein [Terracidiphilus sp.]